MLKCDIDYTSVVMFFGVLPLVTLGLIVWTGINRCCNEENHTSHPALDSQDPVFATTNSNFLNLDELRPGKSPYVNRSHVYANQEVF
ncbi:hypothetical protein Ciccas_007542 [Cichlidogyrus casuarinus]|uniref:Uncharacterized protein n=1 Tax=Cichlidogyrus casuarinus TaxID=1844966 RepID=A0ABD2Q2N6_9PLAT